MGRLKKKKLMKLSAFSAEKDSKKSTSGKLMGYESECDIEVSSELDVISKEAKGLVMKF